MGEMVYGTCKRLDNIGRRHGRGGARSIQMTVGSECGVVVCDVDV